MRRLLLVTMCAAMVAGCIPVDNSAEIAELSDKLDAIDQKLTAMEERAEAAETRNAEMAKTIKLLDRKMTLGF